MAEGNLLLRFLRSIVAGPAASVQGCLRHMNRRRAGLGQAPYQDEDAGDDERYAQPLTHIENHTCLESRLVLFDELYQEPHAEEHYEKYAEDGAGTQPVQLSPVQPEQHQPENQVAQGLVDLGRMVRHPVPPGVQRKDESPGQVGLYAVDLGVHQVAAAYHHACETDRYHETVYELYVAETVFLTVLVDVPPHRNQNSHCSSVRGQAALPCHEYLPGMGEIIFEIVSDAVSQTGTHYSAYHQGEEQYVETLERNALPFVERAHDVIAERKKSRHEEHAVPPQVKAADGQDVRADRPGNSKKIKHIVQLVR